MNPTIAAQRRLLTTSALITFTVGFLAGIHRDEGLPTARFIVGIGLAYTICSAMVDMGSPVGAGFAALIMISAMLYNGEDALALLGVHVGKAPKVRGKDRKAIRRIRSGLRPADANTDFEITRPDGA